jgi:hypothetical protein
MCKRVFWVLNVESQPLNVELRRLNVIPWLPIARVAPGAEVLRLGSLQSPHRPEVG